MARSPSTDRRLWDACVAYAGTVTGWKYQTDCAGQLRKTRSPTTFTLRCRLRRAMPGAASSRQNGWALSSQARAVRLLPPCRAHEGHMVSSIGPPWRLASEWGSPERLGSLYKCVGRQSTLVCHRKTSQGRTGVRQSHVGSRRQDSSHVVHSRNSAAQDSTFPRDSSALRRASGAGGTTRPSERGLL